MWNSFKKIIFDQQVKKLVHTHKKMKNSKKLLMRISFTNIYSYL